MFVTESLAIKYVCLTSVDSVLSEKKKRICWVNASEIEMIDEVEGGSCITFMSGNRKWVRESVDSIIQAVMGEK